MVMIGNKSIKELLGVVVSDKNEKTRTVVVKTVKTHKKYGKRFTKDKKYHVHDEQNKSKVGDTVKFRESRPTSKTKRWLLIEVL